MSCDEWKLEDDLCRCCHSEGSFKNLSKGYIFDNEEQFYVDMLKYTLDIHIAPVLGALCTAAYTICEPCILKLQEATTFKKQVLRCEEKFKDMYTRNFIKVAASADVEIKDEPPEEKEVAQQDIPFMDGDDFHIKDDECDKHDDDDEEFTSKRVKHEGKKRSRKAPTKSKSQPKPKKPPKRGRPRKGDEVVATEKTEGGTSVDDYVTVTIGTDPRKRYVCKACEVSYGRLSDLRYHVTRAHLKQKFIQCEKCSETFMYHSQRKVHMYQAHLTETPEKFQCEICARQFRRKNTLAEHMLDVHIERKCSFCESSFVRKKYLFHLNENHGVAMPTCGICGLRTLLQSTLIRHQRNVHLREKTKVCTVCSKRFHTESNLKDHMITHFQERVFKCGVCGKGFARKECYRTHCRIHTGEKPFSCRLCGVAYVQRASLRFHVRSRHGRQEK